MISYYSRSTYYLSLVTFFICSSFSAPLSAQAVDSNIASAPSWDNVLNQARNLPRLYSLLVSRDGRLLHEYYFNGKTANDIANVKSVSKSLMSALVGIAIEKGAIDDVNDEIAQFFPQELSNQPSKAQIQVGHLLSMQSGLETTSNRNYGRWVLSNNWVQFALQQPFYDRPDGRMIYSTGNTHLLSAIITKSSGQSTLAFARQNLFQPMGIHLASWPRDPQGIYFGGNDMELTPRQMLAFGQLYINEGKHNNQQIIPNEWVDLSVTPRVASPRGQGRHYGYGWWIRDTAGYETPYAWGYGGQFILLVPEENMVVVVTSNSNPGDNRRQHTRAAYRLVEDVVGALSEE